MTYLLYVFICFCLTNELLSSPNDLFAELWENNLPTKDTPKKDRNVEPHEEHSFGGGKQASAFKVLRIKEEPHEEASDYGREYYGAIQVKQETDDGAVQVKQETYDGAVQVKHESQIGAVQDQEEYLSDGGYSLNSSSGGSDYEKSNDFEEENDSLSNEEQQKSEKKIKFGMGYENSKYQSKKLSDSQREKIIKKFDKMKEKRISKNKFAKRTEIEEEIARELGVSKTTINNWKVKFGKNNLKQYSREEKLKIVKQFKKRKNENKGKTIEGSSYDKENKIAKELGASRSAIWRWKKKLGISKLHGFTESERLKLIKKYSKMIKQNPHISRKDIAAKLNTSQRSINRWIKELKNKLSENNTDSDSTDDDNQTTSSNSY